MRKQYLVDDVPIVELGGWRAFHLQLLEGLGDGQAHLFEDALHDARWLDAILEEGDDVLLDFVVAGGDLAEVPLAEHLEGDQPLEGESVYLK